MKQLTRNEEHVLLSILNLAENAYLVTIKEFLEEQTGKPLSFGTLYVSLKRLEKWGYIKSSVGEATSKRGGKAIKFYSLKKHGLEALQEISDLQNKMWKNFEELSLNV